MGQRLGVHRNPGWNFNCENSSCLTVGQGQRANMASIRGWSRGLQLLHVLLGETRVRPHVLLPSFCLPSTISGCLSVGVFLVLPEGVLSLELLPSSSEVLLRSSENFTVVSKRSFIWPVCLHSCFQVFCSSGVFWMESGFMALTSGLTGGWCWCGGSGVHQHPEDL